MSENGSDVRSLDVPGRWWRMWHEEGAFTKNPDVVPLPNGRLLCVVNVCDAHWPREFTRITLIESRDRGRTWGNPRVVSAAYPGKGDERWVTPRLSLLRDGRLVIVCDQNDYRHCHEAQPPGIYLWWSHDMGETWDGPHPTGIIGIEPDHVVELADGTLLCGTHYMRAATQKLTEAVARSTDGGRTWGNLTVIGGDSVHNYCEGAILPLASGRLVCVMRENNHHNYPSYLSFSDDDGWSWSRPVEAPFSGDRPFAGQLPDGRVLVTYRNQTGRPGLHAWLGDIERESGYKVSRGGIGPAHGVAGPDAQRPGGFLRSAGARLDSGALWLENGPDTITRYLLLPPESFASDVTFTAALEVEGEDGTAAATLSVMRLGLHLTVAPDGLSLGRNTWAHVDMRRRRTLAVTHRGGLVEVRVDGDLMLANLIYREAPWERSYFGNGPEHRGASRWYAASYRVENPTESPHFWHWDAASGVYPNQYAIERTRELDYNPTSPRPDHGYSSWVRFDDGEIFVADYTNEDAPQGKSALRGYTLRAEDFP